MSINLGFLKENVKKQLVSLTTKFIQIGLFSLLFTFLSWQLLKKACVTFTEFWPLQSDVPTHQFGDSSVIKFLRLLTLIMSLFLYF